MSDKERMDRAERIRQMREGTRAGTDGASDGGDESDPAADADGGPDATERSDAAAAGGETAAIERAEGPTTESPGADAADAAPRELDEAVAAAVQRVSGASAPVASGDEGPTGDEPTDPAAGADGPTDGAVPDAREEPETADDSGEADGAGDAPTDEDGQGAPGPAAEATGHRATADTRVLEFGLGDEQYCLDIEYVEEIVKDEMITRVPNTPEFVEGVVDLRGQITTILNPKVLIGIEDTTPGELLVVFDSEAFDDQGHLGWVVDDVRQVAPVFEDDVNDPPVADDHVRGVIDREDEGFVVWTTPEMAFEEAA